MTVHVQSADFDPLWRPEGRAFQEAGAEVRFIGTVRTGEEGSASHETITKMEIEHYPGMTERELEHLRSIALERWQLIECAIIHRFGNLYPGDRIVLVATWARHRKEAFAACQFVIDELKTRAPFWKKETFADGSVHWVEPHTQPVTMND